MANGTAIHQLINDIQTLRHRLWDGRTEQDDAYVAAYLLANRPLIEACLDVVTETTSEEDRRALQRAHPTLDAGCVPASWWENIPRTAVTNASTHYIGLDDFRDDGLHMLRRALEYAAHCPQLQREFRLLLSPTTARKG